MSLSSLSKTEITQGSQKDRSKHQAPTTASTSKRPSLLIVFTLIAVFAAIIYARHISSFRSSVSRLSRTLEQGVGRAPLFDTISTITQIRPVTTSTVMSKKGMKGEDADWNRLAAHMDKFHSHFRMEFNQIYTLAEGGYEKQGLTLPRFLREAKQLSAHLDLHHRIEAYVFPYLAKKMPQFAVGGRESGEHLLKHKGIHDGLDKYDAYLAESLANPSKYDGKKLKEILDGFREVLFTHLDEEVHDLGAESMKAAGWTLDEFRRVPM